MSVIYLILVLATGTATIPQSDTSSCEKNKTKVVRDGMTKSNGVIEAYCVGGVK